MDIDLSGVKQAYIEADQAHLFKYWDQLNADEQNRFLSQLSKIPNPCKFIKEVQDAFEYSSSTRSRTFSPLPASSYSTTLSNEPEALTKLKDWSDLGLKLLSENKVGVVLMAGGQGTRLGSSDPKGCYNVGLPSKKSLFQLQAERLIKLQELAGESTVIPLYIMTSGPTREATESFFKKNEYFGLKADQVVFFDQGVLPALSLDGSKFLLETKCSLVESPDGNGGLYKAIHENGLLEDFKKRQIEHIHMYCVDNVLVKVGDPVFIGYSASNGYEIATKVVRKRDSSESVGLIVLDADNGTPCVVEYSEISKELSEETDSDGLLRLRAANIVNHYYSVSFLSKMIPQWLSSRTLLPFHIAKKKIGSIDTSTKDGVFIKAGSEPNGIKMEQFIFDVFPSVELSKFGCLEVDRKEEFSPLKNAPGSANDTPESCCINCLERGTNWLIKAGAKLRDGQLVEVSPLTSYSGEGLERFASTVIIDEIV